MGNLKPGESELSAAWKRSLLFHMIHPRDGWGMQLLRQGYFADSPTADVLQDGLPLPDNRAKVRVEILRRLREERIEPFHAHWEIINTGIVTKLLLEPLVADLSVVEPFVNEAARRFRRATQVYDPFNSRVI